MEMRAAGGRWTRTCEGRAEGRVVISSVYSLIECFDFVVNRK
jgi:hypothetical protein